MLSWFRKTLDNTVLPENEQVKKLILKQINFAVKIGHPFLIEKAYFLEYLRAGGKREEIEEYIKQAKINEANKPEWDDKNDCPYCKIYQR